jgi:hypothetical protein
MGRGHKIEKSNLTQFEKWGTYNRKRRAMQYQWRFSYLNKCAYLDRQQLDFPHTKTHSIRVCRDEPVQSSYLEGHTNTFYNPNDI